MSCRRAPSFQWMAIEIGWLWTERLLSVAFGFRCHFQWNDFISEFLNSRPVSDRIRSVFTSLPRFRLGWSRWHSLDVPVIGRPFSRLHEEYYGTTGLTVRCWSLDHLLVLLPAWRSGFFQFFRLKKALLSETVISNKMPIYQACFTLPPFFPSSFWASFQVLPGIRCTVTGHSVFRRRLPVQRAVQFIFFAWCLEE